MTTRTKLRKEEKINEEQRKGIMESTFSRAKCIENKDTKMNTHIFYVNYLINKVILVDSPQTVRELN